MLLHVFFLRGKIFTSLGCTQRCPYKENALRKVALWSIESWTEATQNWTWSNIFHSYLKRDGILPTFFIVGSLHLHFWFRESTCPLELCALYFLGHLTSHVAFGIKIDPSIYISVHLHLFLSHWQMQESYSKSLEKNFVTWIIESTFPFSLKASETTLLPLCFSRNILGLELLSPCH